MQQQQARSSTSEKTATSITCLKKPQQHINHNQISATGIKNPPHTSTIENMHQPQNTQQQQNIWLATIFASNRCRNQRINMATLVANLNVCNLQLAYFAHLLNRACAVPGGPPPPKARHIGGGADGAACANNPVHVQALTPKTKTKRSTSMLGTPTPALMAWHIRGTNPNDALRSIQAKDDAATITANVLMRSC